MRNATITMDAVVTEQGCLSSRTDHLLVIGGSKAFIDACEV